jgi:hypothetical protein
MSIIIDNPNLWSLFPLTDRTPFQLPDAVDPETKSFCTWSMYKQMNPNPLRGRIYNLNVDKVRY